MSSAIRSARARTATRFSPPVLAGWLAHDLLPDGSCRAFRGTTWGNDEQVSSFLELCRRGDALAGKLVGDSPRSGRSTRQVTGRILDPRRIELADQAMLDGQPRPGWRFGLIATHPGLRPGAQATHPGLRPGAQATHPGLRPGAQDVYRLAWDAQSGALPGGYLSRECSDEATMELRPER